MVTDWGILVEERERVLWGREEGTGRGRLADADAVKVAVVEPVAKLGIDIRVRDKQNKGK